MLNHLPVMLLGKSIIYGQYWCTRFALLRNCLTDCAAANNMRTFSIASIISYFMKAIAGAVTWPNTIVKSMTKLPYQLFKMDTSQIFLSERHTVYFFVVWVCLLEMRMDWVYEILMGLQQTTASIKMPDADASLKRVQSPL